MFQQFPYLQHENKPIKKSASEKAPNELRGEPGHVYGKTPSHAHLSLLTYIFNKGIPFKDLKARLLDPKPAEWVVEKACRDLRPEALHTIRNTHTRRQSSAISTSQNFVVIQDESLTASDHYLNPIAKTGKPDRYGWYQNDADNH